MEHKTKEDFVADFLREGIISGKFPRGSKLRQAKLAALIGTSITPVREALKLLEAEGFVVGTSHRGAVVAPFDIDATQEVVDLRIILENRLAVAALRRIAPSDFAELQRLQHEFASASARADKDAVRSINYRFHDVLYNLAELPQTLRLVRILWARYPFDLINRLEGRIDRAAQEHDAILQAIVGNDPTRLMTTLSAHIRSGWDEFLQSGAAPARGSGIAG